ncbi:hypothetical protein [Wolbachia endosymbiont of Drosophila tristis]|uniref:hypothetical protein n=1 Tax=Wolbachia endosymbiont of Drosophila tristis TaxID=267696 RepID=UPI0023AA0239|nr:hypothetical protein [Wolbachia endosymbiont of Drosophila tristis]MDE5064743.1 hypothetical protein [Wolbachia endosymbiont of Drosophila tristis]MDU8919869.1 hypothetical protein [Wolbachia endosymbiont of Drosophila tristis]
MTDSGISITFDPKTSHNLTKLAEITKESVQELAKRLIIEGIECEVEDIALYKTIKECEDVDWNTVLSERERT